MVDDITRDDADFEEFESDDEELDDFEESTEDGVEVGESDQRDRQAPRRRAVRAPEGPGGGGRPRPPVPGGGGGRRSTHFQPRRRVCVFCADQSKTIDWKDIDTLQRFISETGDIRPRRKTGTCARHQRRLAEAIKRARTIALLPFTGEHVRITGGGRR